MHEDAGTLRAVASDKILFRLREMFGDDRAQLFTGARFRTADAESRVVAFPQNIEELSEMLQLASSERWHVIPAGAGTWLGMGNRPTQRDLVISTVEMSRVLEYEPADLTATVEAGCALAAFNKLASEHRQFIPLDPFGSEDSTIGGIIATAGSGPLRCAYGTPRDWLIGIRVVHADGKITKAGGKVVKNVAGYDLCKLYTGSFGTLAVIAEMSFKLRALPPSEITLLLFADNQNALCSFVSRIAQSDLQPAACELFSPGDPALPIEPDRYTLAMRFRNDAETIESQIDDALRLGAGFDTTTLSERESISFWQIYRDSETADRWEISIRLSALPSDLNALLDQLNNSLPGTHWRAHAANGVVRLHAEAGWLGGFKERERAGKIAGLRQYAQSIGGQLVILHATDDISGQFDVWGEAGATAHLMRSLKEKFDPNGLLNPGIFVGGI